MFFLYFRQYYSFIGTYSIRYDKTLLYIFMFHCDNILILSVLPAFEPNRIALRFHLKYLYNSGSPPQVRGKPRLNPLCSRPPRITPAGAGKTEWLDFAFNPVQDHPRRCGENLGQLRFDTSILGSPPQVRGKQRQRPFEFFQIGITPAGAGKTQFFVFAPRRDKDHPRRCGENPVTAAVTPLKPGSPPQVRGKLLFVFCRHG